MTNPFHTHHSTPLPPSGPRVEMVLALGGATTLEIPQNGMGGWLWDVRNELIRRETGWSTFEERGAKAMVKWMLKVVFEENLVFEIGRVCLIELGCK